jgi:hypothetical protein
MHPRSSRNKKIYKRLTIITMSVLVAIFVGAGILWTIVPDTLLSSAPSSSSLIIDNIRCETVEHTTFHIHAHLDIFINGKPYTVPSQIGIIPDKCIYWIHTHDDTGVIHIESPENRNFTLGQFFDIWNKKFNNTQIFDNVVDGNKNNALSVYVKGGKVNAVDYRNIKLNSHDEIAIVYGKLPDTIPANYPFPKGL